MEAFYVITPMIIGGFLVFLIYTSYFLALPPFYQLRKIEYGRSLILNLSSQAEDTIWILPGPRYTSHPTYCLSEDLTFKLNFSVNSNPESPVHVRVYGSSEKLSKNGTNLSEKLDQSIPLNFPRYPGEWLSRTEPPRDGPILYLIVRNLSQQNITVSATYSVIGFYRLGGPFNLIIVFIGILIIGLTLLITSIHGVTFLFRKKEEHSMRAQTRHVLFSKRARYLQPSLQKKKIDVLIL